MSVAGGLVAGPPAALGAGVALVVAAVLTVVVAPERSQLVLTIESGGANEVIVPFGYLIAVAAWAGLTAWLTGESLSRLLPGAIVSGWALHVLLMLSDFAKSLPDAATFSTSFYHAYGRLFCASALTLAVGWAARRHQQGIAAIDVPVLGGALVFLVVLVRYDPGPAVLAIFCGLLIGPALRWLTRTMPGWRSWLQRAVENERAFLVLIFAVAFGLRILYLLRVMTDPNYVATGGDGVVYDDLAWSIAIGNGVPETFRNAYPLLLLGYVRFVAIVYALAGHSYFVLCAVQSAIGALTCVMLYAIAKPLFGVPTARLAAVFTALSFPLLFAAAAIGHQAIDVFMMVLLIWLLGRAVESQRLDLWRWATIGVVLGCAIAVRETNAFFLALILVWMVVVLGRFGMRASGQAVAALVTGTAVVLLPLVAPLVASAESRLRLREHFDRLYTGQGDAVRTRDELARPLSNPDAALRQLKEQPGLVVSTVGRAIVHNFAVQFFTQPFGGFDLVFLRKGSRYYYGLWFHAYVLTAAGLVIAARRIISHAGSAVVVLILGLIAARTLPHLILESHYRHRVPIEPLLILLAALAAVTIGRSIRVRDPIPLIEETPWR